MRWRLARAALGLALGLLLCVSLVPVWAQAPGPAAHLPAAASSSASRQRLALVLGIGTLGSRPVLDSARRDSEAVAAALRAGGFEVLLHHDLDTNALRAALKQFRSSLRADGVGLIYYTGLAAQVDGRNLLLPSDVALGDFQEPSATSALLRAAGLPLQEALNALAGGPTAARALVVDAAYRHPALARLVPPGLARQRVNAGTMVLLGHAPGALQDVPSLPPPPAAPKDLREAVATRFARVMVDALGTPRISVPEALRAIRLAVADSSGGLTQPFLAGETFDKDYLADAVRLENPGATAVAPSTPATPSVPSGAAPAASAAVSAAAPVVAPVPTAAASPASSASAPTPQRPSTDGRTAQAPGQGERPVFQARANSFGHAEGDTLSYQRVDTRKDELLTSYTLSIDEVRNDGHLSANGGQWQLDPQGRLMQQRDEDGTRHRYEPAQEIWWARPQPGESRPVAFKETRVLPDQREVQIEWRGTAQVGSARQIETPAGEFEVLPIKITGQSRQTPATGAPGGGAFTRTVYYAPKLGVPVVIEIEDNDSSGRPLRRERIELMHAQQSRTAN